MKIRDRIHSIISGIKNGMQRFPITIGFSVMMVILLIYFNETRSNMTNVLSDRLTRVNMVVGIGILLSSCISLLRERFFSNNRTKTFISYILGLGILILYYIFLLNDFRDVSIIRYIGTVVFLVLAFFYIPRLKKYGDIYEYYVIDILSNIFLTAIYSIVLLIGLFFIFFTIDRLFDIVVAGKLYYYTFLLVIFVFAVSFFLSKIPENHREFGGYSFSKSLRILLSYIVIPLISIYTIILYIYFTKILISWEWPKGLVSHLVLWYSSISVGIIFLTNRIVEEDRVSRWFRKVFPKVNLPILLMMFISIGQRIGQYGITENRYYILVLGIWVTGMMIYISIKKSIKTIIIPISLSLIVLNSVFGPLSSFTISKFSQNRRLEGILRENGMLENNLIIKKTDLPLDTQIEISNIISYFDNRYTLSDISLLKDDFSLEDMEDVFGFVYEPDNSKGDGEYVFFHINLYEEVVPVVDYDYFVNIVPWGKNSFSMDGLNIEYIANGNSLSIRDGDEEIINLDIKEIIKEIYNRLNIDNQGTKDIRNLEEMTYRLEDDKLKLELIFTNFSGRLNREKELEEISGIEFILLLKRK